MKRPSIDAFVQSYVDTALWASTIERPDGDAGPPMDTIYDSDSLTNRALTEMVRDCRNFREYAADELAASGLSDEDAGHNFWLSRNGHGTGFWDRGLGEIGSKLHEKAKSFGSCYLYVHRNRVHVQ